MLWTEIDFGRAVWVIPAEKAKADEAIDIPLSPFAVRILEERKASSKSVWVFPGPGKSGHLVEPKTAWKRILQRAKKIAEGAWIKANRGKTSANYIAEHPKIFSDLRLHDLRRTLGSWQAATGASLPIIGASLGHSSLEATQVYARLDLDPIRLAVNRATDAMLLAGGVAGLLEAK
jgi:integrase